MVPYQVLQELDNIKDCSKKNEKLKSLAMDSIKYLEKYLQGSDERVQGKFAYETLDKAFKLTFGFQLKVCRTINGISLI